ncbi:MAG: phosphoribosylformylglycinamidine synthase subunit PurL [Actinobacteria bacterium]|nr:phosphoribosylformylglycinamidine synthase subunit PurL [Actinomycetota bacterium]
MSIHRQLGLTDEEANQIEEILGRPPNHLELAMYAVMWSEHCSYKSSRLHLRRLPSDGERVLVGPGENAGVVDVGDGIAAAIRIESHNHPSAIEPYQGAATGVGGILRDIFTMGARPIALLDSLRVGPLDDARSRWVLDGVVSGVSGYGNAVGVPTVGGEVVSDATYTGNPLVNVACLGVMPIDRLVLGRATGVGNLAVLLGSTTGRDGIGGVSVLASAGFGSDGDTDASDEDAAKRPSVQVGDPFEEKRLIEACLALLDAGLVVGIQDLGGAGLACATSETASRGGVGMDVDVAAVPRREPGMEPFEVMTSESQERMLAIVRPDDLDEVEALCRRWDVRATVVGRVTGEEGRLRILDGFDGPVLADMPAASLHEAAPCYDRPRRPAPAVPDLPPVPTGSVHAGDDLLAMVADTAWVWSQYDSQLFLNTVEGPGGDAALLRLKHPVTGQDTGRALALTLDGNQRWCAVDPREGTAMTVAEAVLNLACVGAHPLAVVNCLNFGNPEHPEVMWQLSECIDGMAEACRALGVPVVGGNVSLYNESRGSDIDPTPVIGLLGLVDRLERRPPGVTLVDGAAVLLVGARSSELGGSRWAAEALGGGRPVGSLPALDLAASTATSSLVRDLVADGLLAGVHDVADGGLGVALAELVARSGVGADLDGVDGHGELFSEAPGRVVACVAAEDLAEVERRAGVAGVALARLGTAGGDRLVVAGVVDLGVAQIVDTWRNTLPATMGTPVGAGPGIPWDGEASVDGAER